MAFPTGWGWKSSTFAVDATNVGAGAGGDAFALLITEATIATGSAGGYDDDFWDNVKSDGGDIRASSDSAGLTQLPLEVVSINTTTKKMELWVRRASVSSSLDTDVFLWWGEATESQPAVTDTYGRNAVWSDYEAVWHLNDTTDSTGNAHTLVPQGSPSVVDAHYGKGYDLNGTNQFLHFNTAPITTTPTTMSVFAKSDSLTAEQVVLSVVETGTANNEFKLTFRGDQAGDRIRASSKESAGTDDAATSVAYTTSAYHLASGRWITSSDRRAYIDGGSEGTNTGTKTPSNINGGSIGSLRRGSDIVEFNGIVEEAQISSTDLDPDHLLANYTNQNTPGSFFTSFDAEAVSSGVSVSGDLLLEDVVSTGTIIRNIKASGALVLDDVVSTGSIKKTIKISGDLLLDDVVSTGQITIPVILEDDETLGGAPLGTTVLAGEEVEAQAGIFVSGDLVLEDVVSTGSIVKTVKASGAMVLEDVVSTGAVKKTIKVSGGLILDDVVSTGSVVKGIKASGDLVLEDVVSTGSVSVGGISVSGDLLLDDVVSTGVITRVIKASGNLVLEDVVSTGIITKTVKVSGNLVLGDVVSSGLVALGEPIIGVIGICGEDNSITLKGIQNNVTLKGFSATISLKGKL